VFYRIRNISFFVILSFALTALLIFVNLLSSNLPSNSIEWIYAISIPLYYYFPILAIELLWVPIQNIPYLKYFIVVPKSLFDFYLFIDIFVFKIYKFHFDLLLFNMLLHDFNGFGLPFSVIIFAIISFTIILSINFSIFYKIKHYRTKPIVVFNIFFILMFITGQVIHMFAYEFGNNSILRFTPLAPYYFPLTSSNIMGKIKENYINSNTRDESFINKNAIENIENSIFLDYPKKDLKFIDPERPNILFFIIESWRADMLDKNITPNIYKFSENSLILKNHFSGGNVTTSGLFTLMFGLHPSYYKYFITSRAECQSVFSKTLKNLGYTSELYSSSNLDRFNLKHLMFGDIVEGDYEKIKLSPNDKDEYLISKLIESIKNQKPDQPWFKFVFLISSHYSYFYPPEHKIYTPVPKNIYSLILDNNADSAPLLNDYKNSLHFIDYQFLRIWDELKRSGLDKNTVIVITSDHGEEFNDNNEGYWGHGSNFTYFQTSVPLLLYIPNKANGNTFNRRSSHTDIVPTILSHIFNCSNLISDYSTGADLFNLPDDRNLIFESYKDKAYLISDKIYLNSIFHKNHSLYDTKVIINDFDLNKISKIRSEEKIFLK